MSWFAIRVTYSRELKFQQQLREAGFETFVPMQKKKIERDGNKKEILVPAVSNLCFVNAEKSQLDEFFKELGEVSPARYIWDKATRKPIVVPDKAMQDFIHVTKLMADEVMYLTEITSKLAKGQRVRVVNGPFKGVEGVVLRVKKSRRVVVDLPGMLAVATEFVAPSDLEIL